MARVLYFLDNMSFSDGDTADTEIHSDAEVIQVASTHQLTVIPAPAASGKIKIATVPRGYAIGLTTVATLKDSAGVEIELNLANGPQHVVFDANVGIIGAIVSATIGEGCDITISGW